jgi:sorbitol-specific phosphotransferase system component IIC
VSSPRPCGNSSSTELHGNIPEVRDIKIALSFSNKIQQYFLSPVLSQKALAFQCSPPPYSIPMNVIKCHTPKYNTTAVYCGRIRKSMNIYIVPSLAALCGLCNGLFICHCVGLCCVCMSNQFCVQICVSRVQESTLIPLF